MLELVVAGIITGSIYALVAMGFTVVFKSTDAINFAQGEWVMAGGMIAAALAMSQRLPLAIIVPAAAIAVVILGIVSERLAIFPLRRPSAMSITLITVGLAIATKALITLVLGKAPMGFAPFTPGPPLHLGAVSIERQSLWIVGVLLLVVTTVYVFFEYTLFGKALRAAAADRGAAELVGIDVARTVTWSFGLAAFLGATAGIIMTPMTMTSFNAGTILGFKGFSAAMLGGLGNVFGAVVGGIVLGLLESLAAGLLSSQYKDAVAFVMLIAVLLARPQGIFGRAQAIGSK